MTSGGIAEIRKGIKNDAKMEKEKKMRLRLKKTKYIMVKTGNEREQSTRKCKISNSTEN